MTITDTELRQIAKLILTPKQFEAWELHRYRRCSYGIIAYMLDIDKGTVRDRIKRAEHRLDRWIRDNREDHGNVPTTPVSGHPTPDPAGKAAA